MNIINTLEESLFPVIEQSAPHPYYQDEGWETQPTGYKYIMREDTAEIISCKTDDYMLIPNKRIIDSIQPTIDKLNGELIDVAMFGNARTSYKYRFPQKVGVDGDMLNPEIIIRNSYDGSVGIHILAGAFRLICSNGLIIGMIVKEINSKHLVHNKDIQLLETNINHTLEMMMNLMDTVIGKLMSASPVNPGHIAEVIGFFPKRVSHYATEQMIKQHT